MALQTRQKRRRSRVRDTAAAGVVDTSRKTWPSLTDEGRTLTLEGQARFRPATWSWPASQIGENA
ncbi:hypothetical protein FEH38_24345 [Escherichia coli]|nr:hypothetical protein [Escherichia coli]EFC6857914.1 hypothetical protein [Escherichia coli]